MVPYSTCESAAIAVTHVIFALFAVVVALTALIQVWAQDFPALDMKTPRSSAAWKKRVKRFRLGDRGQLIGTSNG